MKSFVLSVIAGICVLFTVSSVDASGQRFVQRVVVDHPIRQQFVQRQFVQRQFVRRPFFRRQFVQRQFFVREPFVQQVIVRDRRNLVERLIDRKLGVVSPLRVNRFIVEPVIVRRRGFFSF